MPKFHWDLKAGRRTGRDLIAEKNPRKDSLGFFKFEDFLVDSDLEPDTLNKDKDADEDEEELNLSPLEDPNHPLDKSLFRPLSTSTPRPNQNGHRSPNPDGVLDPAGLPLSTPWPISQNNLSTSVKRSLEPELIDLVSEESEPPLQEPAAELKIRNVSSIHNLVGQQFQPDLLVPPETLANDPAGLIENDQHGLPKLNQLAEEAAAAAASEQECSPEDGMSRRSEAVQAPTNVEKATSMRAKAACSFSTQTTPQPARVSRAVSSMSIRPNDKTRGNGINKSVATDLHTSKGVGTSFRYFRRAINKSILTNKPVMVDKSMNTSHSFLLNYTFRRNSGGFIKRPSSLASRRMSSPKKMQNKTKSPLIPLQQSASESNGHPDQAIAKSAVLSSPSGEKENVPRENQQLSEVQITSNNFVPPPSNMTMTLNSHLVSATAEQLTDMAASNTTKTNHQAESPKKKLPKKRPKNIRSSDKDSDKEGKVQKKVARHQQKISKPPSLCNEFLQKTLIPPSSSPEVRRSQRTRVPPVDFWRNEMPIYEGTDTGLKLVGVDPGKQVPWWLENIKDYQPLLKSVRMKKVKIKDNTTLNPTRPRDEENTKKSRNQNATTTYTEEKTSKRTRVPDEPSKEDSTGKSSKQTRVLKEPSTLDSTAGSSRKTRNQSDSTASQERSKKSKMEEASRVSRATAKKNAQRETSPDDDEQQTQQQQPSRAAKSSGKNQSDPSAVQERSKMEETTSRVSRAMAKKKKNITSNNHAQKETSSNDEQQQPSQEESSKRKTKNQKDNTSPERSKKSKLEETSQVPRASARKKNNSSNQKTSSVQPQPQAPIAMAKKKNITSNNTQKEASSTDEQQQLSRNGNLRKNQETPLSFKHPATPMKTRGRRRKQ